MQTPSVVPSLPSSSIFCGNLLRNSISLIWFLFSLWTCAGFTWSSSSVKFAVSFCSSSFEFAHHYFDCCFCKVIELFKANYFDFLMAPSLNLPILGRSWRLGNAREFLGSVKLPNEGISYSLTVGYDSFGLIFTMLLLKLLLQFLFV